MTAAIVLTKAERDRGENEVWRAEQTACFIKGCTQA